MVEETEIVEGSEGRSTICTLFGSYSEDRRKQPHAIKGYDYLITDYTNSKVRHEINPNYLIFDLHARGLVGPQPSRILFFLWCTNMICISVVSLRS